MKPHSDFIGRLGDLETEDFVIRDLNGFKNMRYMFISNGRREVFYTGVNVNALD